MKICDGHVKRQGNIVPLNCRTALSKGNLADNTFYFFLENFKDDNTLHSEIKPLFASILKLMIGP